MENNIFIKEIFESIQGEGPYIGYNQLFIRFSKCNLNCKYCDTDFKTADKKYTPMELLEVEKQYNNVHSISLTGGEPLLDVDFLEEFLPLVSKKVYLETNGTLYENLERIINYVDIVAMDIKLNSTSNNGDLFNKHEEFIKVAVENSKEIFVKIVFDMSITDEEIETCINLANKYNVLVVLQPKMDGDNLNISSIEISQVFNKFVSKYDNVRLIPQVHKFINVR